MRKLSSIVLLLFLCWPLSSHAALIVSEPLPGEFVVLDEDTNLMWVQDANLSQTMGYDADGHMNWADATAWAQGLDYAGYSDWRLPSTNLTGFGNINDGDLGHLFYDHEIEDDYIDGVEFPFFNIHSLYWTSEVVRPRYVAVFNMDSGSKGEQHHLVYVGMHAWAVRSAAAAIPEPASLILLGSGLVGLMGLRRRR